MINALKFYRQRANISQAKLASKIGVPRPLISYFETGIAEPPFEMKQQIARILKCLVVDIWKEGGQQ